MTIIEVLGPKYIRFPKTADEWRQVAREFWDKWNMPNCIGAIDGRHTKIQNPPNAGSLYFNFKQYYSIVQLSIVDANYCFMWVDAGGYSSGSDSGIYKNTGMYKKIAEDKLNIPADEQHPVFNIPFYFVGDAAFALEKRMMKPQRGITKEKMF